MRRILHIFSTSLLVGVLVSCSTNYRPRGITSTQRELADSWRGHRRDLLNPYSYNPTAKDRSASGVLTNRQAALFAIACDSNQPSPARKAARNLLQNAILRLSDTATSRHLAGLKATENSANLLFGGAALALSGGATVAAEATARTLSAAATGAGGFRGLLNEQVYRNALGETIVRAIETDRSEFLASIILPNQTKSIADYDVEAAIRDANDYHQRGSLFHGLALVREAAEKANAATKARADDERKADADSIDTLRTELVLLCKQANVANVAALRYAEWVRSPAVMDILGTNAPVNLGAFLNSTASNSKLLLRSLRAALEAKE